MAGAEHTRHGQRLSPGIVPMRILVTGANGLLGSFLVPYLKHRGHDVVTHARRPGADVQFDLADSKGAAGGIDAVSPDAIVNLAAMTNVDECESDFQGAFAANALTVSHLAGWSRAGSGRHLVHISTDQLYDAPGPCTETQVTIRNAYALTKFTGELMAAGDGVTILRTNFFGRSRAPQRVSFTDWLYRALVAGTPTPVFDDVQFSPLSFESLARCIAHALHTRPRGTFNVGASSGCSKADFAFAFARVLELSPAGLVRTEIAAAGSLKARRPHDMRMDSSQFEKMLGERLPTVEEEIRAMRSEYRDPT